MWQRVWCEPCGLSSRAGAVLAVALIAFQGCGDDPVGPPDSFIVVVPSEATLLLGEELQLRAVVLNVDADSVPGAPLTWLSLDEEVASVDGSGRVTAEGVGSALMQATRDGLVGSALVSVAGLTFSEVSAGALHTCGVTRDEEVYCWGHPTQGQLGIGEALPEPDQPTPALVQGGHRFSSVSAGARHTCAIRTDGRAMCWGFNHFGELGDADLSGGTKFEPVPVALTAQFISLSSAWHTCGITTTGSTHCWGPDFLGELGDGDPVYYGHATVAVADPASFEAVTTGQAEFSCGLTEDGTAWCWGDNSSGQLGDGGGTASSVPVPVSGGLRFKAISAGASHACAIATDEAMFCWGSGQRGQLGDGASTSREVPTPVVGGLLFRAVSSGYEHSCGITTDGELHCWGANQAGQLGDGSTTSSPEPRRVQTTESFDSVSAGALHTCALSVAGTAYCWGSNEHAQLGDGTYTSHHTPARVLGQL